MTKSDATTPNALLVIDADDVIECLDVADVLNAGGRTGTTPSVKCFIQRRFAEGSKSAKTSCMKLASDLLDVVVDVLFEDPPIEVRVELERRFRTSERELPEGAELAVSAEAVAAGWLHDDVEEDIRRCIP